MITLIGIIALVLGILVDYFIDWRWLRVAIALQTIGAVCLAVSFAILCIRYLP